MAHPTRIFKEPADLKTVWEKYKSDLIEKETEWPKIQYVGKEGEKKTDYPKLPLTLEGLKRFCWDNEYGHIEQYFTNQDGLYDEFIGICRAIKNEIRENQLIGGMLNFYNPSITQRLNGLAENQNVNVKAEQPLFPES